MPTRSIDREIALPCAAEASADEFFAGCQQGWTDTLAGALRHVRSQVGPSA